MLVREGAHPKHVHKSWTGPWEVEEVVIPGPNFNVVMGGRSMPSPGVRRKRGEIPLEAYRSSSRLRRRIHSPLMMRESRAGESSALASPVCLFPDREVARGGGKSWNLRCKGRNVKEAESHWLTEEKARDSFMSLSLDAFHALREPYHKAEHHPRSAPTQTKAETKVEGSKNALNEFPWE